MAPQPMNPAPPYRRAARSLLILSLLLFPACDVRPAHDAPRRTAAPADPDTAPVTINGKTFRLELALDTPTRTQGLSGRDHIDPAGGMLFVFPFPAHLSFVMRDCPVPIDLAFLDSAGRVLAVHHMTPDPRHPGESDAAYEARLHRYDSRFAAQFAVEVAGGTLDRLALKPGDLVRFDAEGLKRLAR